MKKISESQLIEKVASLKELLAEVAQNQDQINRAKADAQARQAAARGSIDDMNTMINSPNVDAMGNVTGGTLAPAPALAIAGKPATVWPTTPEQIKAFQTANKLKPDGMIGQKTMAALTAAGAKAPAGFVPVGNKAAPKPTPVPAVAHVNQAPGGGSTANTAAPTGGGLTTAQAAPDASGTTNGDGTTGVAVGVNPAVGQMAAGQGTQQPTAENLNPTDSVMYSEDQTLARIIQLARLK